MSGGCADRSAVRRYLRTERLQGEGMLRTYSIVYTVDLTRGKPGIGTKTYFATITAHSPGEAVRRREEIMGSPMVSYMVFRGRLRPVMDESGPCL